MKSTSVVAASLLATIAIAQPHRQHQAFHHKRDNSPVVWTTEWDVVTEIVDVTTTVWVSEGYVPPTSSASTSLETTSAVGTPIPAQFFEPAATPSPSPSTSSTSFVYVAPAPPASTSVPPTSVAAPSPAYVAPVQSSSSSSVAAPVAAPAPEPVTPTTSAYVAPTPTTPAYVAPVQSTTPAAAATTSASSSSGSTGGVCSESSPCSGDITHYDTGVGACGWPNVSTDKVIALPYALMGTQSNGNPYCGKTVTISLNGKTTQAEVVDKCMGCVGDSIDLSDGVFEELADMALGRVHDVTWYFN